ncbi:MAG: DegV family protein, partial [Desulfopila sp.]|nr:DegV family protein [Desulfopila sp.]
QGIPIDSENTPLHIVTDAAGSLTRETAWRYGITLLDSYIIAGDQSRPESLYSSAEIYPLMRQGIKITTAQASTFERQQHYHNICRQFGPSLYLAVGSAFTGNYDAALSWKKEHDPEDIFQVIDTGAASGRLALIALQTARFAAKAGSAKAVLKYAAEMIECCEEFVFIHELKYLVAGGRVSRTGGFFGDLLSMKPIISPTRSGVKKVGIVRSTEGQLRFAVEKAAQRYQSAAPSVIMLQYSDNHSWVEEKVEPQIRKILPQAEILLAPLSLTSGVHMGPGAWSMALAFPEHGR